MKKFILSVIFVSATTIFAQNAGNTNQAAAPANQAAPTDSQEQEKEPLPNGYRSISLGTSLDAVKDLLTQDDYFVYRGDPDVTMIEEPNRTSIEVRGAGFIKRAYFLFYEEKLYTIILELNGDRLDYNSLYTTFRQKYGDANNLDPKSAYWENDTTRISVEKPLYIKYLDKAIFQQLQEKSQIIESYKQTARDNFLKQF